MIEVKASEIISLDKTKGVGPSNVTLTANANLSSEERFAKFHVVKGGETIEVTVSQEAGKQVDVIPKFDYLVLKFEWDNSNGVQFDSATCLTNTRISDIDGKFAGWSRGYTTTSEKVLDVLRYGGNNLLQNNESVLINMYQLLNNSNLDSNELNVDMNVYGNWYESKADGNVNVNFTAYLGGLMSLSNFSFKNSGGKEVYNNTFTIKVDSSGKDNYMNINQLYSKMINIVYDKEKKDGVLFL